MSGHLRALPAPGDPDQDEAADRAGDRALTIDEIDQALTHLDAAREIATGLLARIPGALGCEDARDIIDRLRGAAGQARAALAHTRLLDLGTGDRPPVEGASA